MAIDGRDHGCKQRAAARDQRAVADRRRRHRSARVPAASQQPAAGFAQDQVGGGQIPVMRVRLDEGGVERAVGDHGEPVGKRGHMGARARAAPASSAGSASTRSLRPADLADSSPASRTASATAVLEGAAAGRRREGLVPRRAVEHAGERPARPRPPRARRTRRRCPRESRACRRSDRRRRCARADSRAGAVDRLLRQPAIVGPRRQQRFAQEGVDRVVGLADRRRAALHPDFRVRCRSSAWRCGRPRARPRAAAPDRRQRSASPVSSAAGKGHALDQQGRRGGAEIAVEVVGRHHVAGTCP